MMKLGIITVGDVIMMLGGLFILIRLIHMYPVLFTYRFNRISLLLCFALLVFISVQLKKLWNNTMYQEMHLALSE